MLLFSLALFATNLFAQGDKPAASEPTAGKFPDAAELDKMAARFAPTDIRANTAELSPADKKAIVKLIEAAHIIDAIQIRQRWSGNEALYADLQKDGSALGKARLHYFWINKGPWSLLDDNKAFLPNVPAVKPPGGNFYPEDATKEELEQWMNSLDAKDKEQAESFFTVIHRENGKFTIVPYSQEYAAQLGQAADLLREASQLTDNASLKKFLKLRADAFLSNDYFDSDIAWMDLDSPLDVTIGPYETYNDDLFGYKAAFEAYVNVRDKEESKKLGFYSQHLQEIENNLPIPQQYRNPKLGSLSPIVVVNEVIGAGDGNMGVQTAAYNLPNDDRVVQQKGAKRVMLKNVQLAKFKSILVPIAKTVLTPSAQKDLDFDSFFTHILCHELTHGLGPHVITVNGKQTSPRQELKEVYGAIEESKADVTGLFALQWMMDQGLLKNSLGQGPAAEHKLYTTYLASSFRTLRFGLKEAHARGMAIQMNYILDKGGYTVNPDGTFSVNYAKIKGAVRDLDHDLLMLEANGDYAGAKKMLADMAVLRPPVKAAIDKLNKLPTDIEPVFVTANALSPAPGEGMGMVKTKKAAKGKVKKAAKK